MYRHSLSVDARLRLVLVYLDTLKLPATAAGDSSNIPQLQSPEALASWLTDMSDEAAMHVRAIYLALPAQCLSLDAPRPGGAR
jgi:hypothetical protein